MREFPKSSIVVVLAFTGILLFAQDASYLTQKLMVENDIRERVTTALSKLMRPSQFVVHVEVDLELSDAMEEQVTFAGDTEEPNVPAATSEKPASAGKVQNQASSPESSFMGGLPIPGFEFEVQPDSEPETVPESEVIPEEIRETPVAVEKKEKILSRTASKRRPAVAKIVRKTVHIILQEDTPPELLENVRTIVTATAAIQPQDDFTITTASFKERREAKKAEKILLQSIANKIQSLEDQQKQESIDRERNWEEELKRYRDDEAKRREEDRLYFKQQLSQLESAAKERAFEEEKKRILRRDSLEINKLDQEIQTLKAQITQSNVDSQKVAATTQLSQKEQERQQLDKRLEDKIGELNQVQAEIDRLNHDMEKTPTMTIVLVAILGSLFLILLIVLIFILLNRSRQPVYPPVMMPPPRRRKRKKPAPKTPPATPQPVAPAPAPAPTQPTKSVEEDPAVLSSEVSDMRQAVVSMSVGQPHTATRIVKEWMQQEAPPPPPEP
ncbi:MAG: hypothetical protein ACE5D1_07080, partial [Fidelibacterota bacterium]